MMDRLPASASGELFAAAEEAAGFVLETGLVEAWLEGAIYPSELAFFLAVCTANQINAIVESGRQDGYSTEILGRWAKWRGTEVYSIDLEQERERAARCRKRLQPLPLTLIRGSAYSEIGRTVEALSGRRVPLLVDGPKGWPALSTVAAVTARPQICVVALHNLADWVPQRPWFRERGGTFYEDTIKQPGPRWCELRRREIVHGKLESAARSLEVSSLGVLVIDNAHRRASLSRAWDRRFGLHQPAIVRRLWNLGAYGLTPSLYGLSYKLLGR